MTLSYQRYIVVMIFVLFKTEMLSCVYNYTEAYSCQPTPPLLKQVLVLEFAQSVAPGVSGSRLNMLNLINAQALLPPLMKLILLGAAPAQTLEPKRVWRNVRLIVSPCVRSSPVTLRDARPRRLRGPRCM